MKIKISEIEFKTKKEIKEYIRKYMYNIIENKIDNDNKYYQIRRGNEMYNFLKELAYFNKEKKELIKEKRIDYFGVQRNEINKKTFHNYIRFKNEEIIDISFLNCVNLMGNENKNKNDYIFDLNQCLRKSINYQIEEFKKITKDKSCSLCKNIDKYHVDHIIKFRDLAKDFLKENKIIPDMIDDNIIGGKKFKYDDDEFNIKWKEYHKNNAKLRILCETCNLLEK